MNKISKLFSLRNIARFSALSLLVSAFSTTDLAAMGANEMTAPDFAAAVL